MRNSLISKVIGTINVILKRNQNYFDTKSMFHVDNNIMDLILGLLLSNKIFKLIFEIHKFILFKKKSVSRKGIS